jgi:hypothetical protein
MVDAFSKNIHTTPSSIGYGNEEGIPEASLG